MRYALSHKTSSTVAFGKISTKFGKLHLGLSEKGIALICFGRSFRTHLGRLKRRFPQIETQPRYFSPARRKLLRLAQQAISSYGKGRGNAFGRLPLDVDGTPFQCRVWQSISKIPWGKTVSYRQLAQRSGKPKALRAAASACGDNRLTLLIPCHRVVGSNGSLGGYAGGLTIKKKLLCYEAVV